MNQAKENPAPMTVGSRAQQSANSSLDNSRDSLIRAMADAGIAPANPAEIVIDGALHRYNVEGDKPGRRNGWYKAHGDGRPAGRFGSWKADLDLSWRFRAGDRLSPADREIMRQHAAEARANRDAEIECQHREAAYKAERIQHASQPADPDHGYLVAKAIKPHRTRQRGDWLVLPVIGFDRQLWSIQFIARNGTKRLMTGGKKQGCFIAVNGRMPGASRVVICEGFATGATLAEAEPEALTLAAIDAGNLHAVATGARRQWPTTEIVICADADEVGIVKGREAAIAAGALLAVPEFPAGAEGSDYNDLAALTAKGAK